MLTAELALDHLFTSSSHSHDLRVGFRNLNRPLSTNFKVTNVLTHLNFKGTVIKHLDFIVGYNNVRVVYYTNLGFEEIKTIRARHGAIVGLQHNLNFLHRNGHIMGTATLARNTKEYQAEIYVEPYKSFQTFVRYYSLGHFDEYTVGIGWRFVYRTGK